MLRKLGRLFTLVGLACLVWIGYSWWTNRPINSYFFLGILILILGSTLLRRPRETVFGDPDGLASPSRRQEARRHKSWIQNDRE